MWGVFQGPAHLAVYGVTAKSASWRRPACGDRMTYGTDVVYVIYVIYVIYVTDIDVTDITDMTDVTDMGRGGVGRRN